MEGEEVTDLIWRCAPADEEVSHGRTIGLGRIRKGAAREVSARPIGKAMQQRACGTVSEFEFAVEQGRVTELGVVIAGGEVISGGRDACNDQYIS